METYIKLIDVIDDELAELYPSFTPGNIDTESIKAFICKRLGEEYAHCIVNIQEHPYKTANAVMVTIHNPEYSSIYWAIIGDNNET